MKHYKDIDAMRKEFVIGFQPGDLITITEKIDGANASFGLGTDGKIFACSRKQELTEDNTLRGFYNYAMSIDPNIFANHPDWIIFGEWLVPHTIHYPEDKYYKFYCFDIWDTATETWQPHEVVFDFAKEHGLLTVPVFYVGLFISWEQVKSFVGQTQMGGEIGEGVVVKNQTRLNNEYGRIPAYTKIVIEKMSEQKKPREISPEEMVKQNETRALVQTVVVKARVEKMLNKFVDEGLIPSDWSSKDMGVIMKNISKRIYEDCMKEANDIVETVGNDFGKYCAKECAVLVKEILMEKSDF